MHPVLDVGGSGVLCATYPAYTDSQPCAVAQGQAQQDFDRYGGGRYFSY